MLSISAERVGAKSTLSRKLHAIVGVGVGRVGSEWGFPVIRLRSLRV